MTAKQGDAGTPGQRRQPGDRARGREGGTEAASGTATQPGLRRGVGVRGRGGRAPALRPRTAHGQEALRTEASRRPTEGDRIGSGALSSLPPSQNQTQNGPEVKTCPASAQQSSTPAAPRSATKLQTRGEHGRGLAPSRRQRRRRTCRTTTGRQGKLRPSARRRERGSPQRDGRGTRTGVQKKLRVRGCCGAKGQRGGARHTLAAHLRQASSGLRPGLKPLLARGAMRLKGRPPDDGTPRTHG